MVDAVESEVAAEEGAGESLGEGHGFSWSMGREHVGCRLQTLPDNLLWKDEQPAMVVLRQKPELVLENGHGFAGEGSPAVCFAGGDAFLQMHRWEIQPVDCAASAGQAPGCDDAAGIELHILIGVARLAGDFADQFTCMIPKVKIAAIPVAADDEVGCDRNAADVIRDIEFEFERQCLFAAFLNDGGTVGAVLGDGDPNGIAIGGDAAGVETVALLNFDMAEFAAVFQEKFVEEAFAGSGVYGGDPQMSAIGIDSLNVVGNWLEFENFSGVGRIQGEECGGRNCQEYDGAHSGGHFLFSATAERRSIQTFRLIE